MASVRLRVSDPVPLRQAQSDSVAQSDSMAQSNITPVILSLSILVILSLSKDELVGSWLPLTNDRRPTRRLKSRILISQVR